MYTKSESLSTTFYLIYNNEYYLILPALSFGHFVLRHRHAKPFTGLLYALLYSLFYSRFFPLLKSTIVFSCIVCPLFLDGREVPAD